MKSSFNSALMSSLNDSDITYCSEHEEKFNEERQVDEQAVRRSQRLSQKSQTRQLANNKNVQDLSSSRMQANALVDCSTTGVPQWQQQENQSMNVLEAADTETIIEQFPPNQLSFTSKNNSTKELTCINPGSQNSLKRPGNCSKHEEPSAKMLKTNMEPLDLCNKPMQSEEIQNVSKRTNLRKRKTATQSTLPINAASRNQAVPIKNKENLEMNKSFLNCIGKTEGDSRKKQTRKTKLPPTRNTSRGKKRNTASKNDNFTQYEPITSILNLQPMDNIATMYNDNALRRPRILPNSVRQSLLPQQYPAHFKHQTIGWGWEDFAVADIQRPPVQDCNFPTPEISDYFDFEDSTSSPSLPDSLRGIFDTDDIREILKVEKVAYRLCEHHVPALALILNLNIDYLREVLEKVLKLNSDILQKIDAALKQMPQLDEGAKKDSQNSPNRSTMVNCSQSPVVERHFPSQRRSQVNE